MAYASLVSLQQTTNRILNHHKYSMSIQDTKNITSIREYVIFLISFLDNSPDQTFRLEGKIRDLANETEDLIEYFMWILRHKDQNIELWRPDFEHRLSNLRGEIGSITGDMTNDRLCNLPAAISSSSVAAKGKNDVVMGLDEDLMAIKERLYGVYSKLEVIPIVGMGGIAERRWISSELYTDEKVW